MFDYTSNIRSRKTIPCTPDMFDIAIHATKVSRICAEIADYREKKLRGEMSREDFETKKSELKRQLPAFLFHAHYSDGHRSNASAVPSGLSIYDIDHIQPQGDLSRPPQRGGDGSTMVNSRGDLGDLLKQHVLSHQPITDKDTIDRMKELGIVLAHISPSGEGLRLVFVIPPASVYQGNPSLPRTGETEGVLPMAQKWLASKLGDSTFDEACKDLARCSFVVPADYILYIDKEQLFKTPSNSPVRGRDGASSAPGVAVKSTSEETQKFNKVNPSLPRTGEMEGVFRIFDETVRAANLTLANLNAVGTRHNSLVTILSMGLCRLMPKEQLKAVVSVRMPEFSREPDCYQLIDDFYSKYTDPSKPMSYKLRKIFTDSLHKTPSGSPVRGSDGTTKLNSESSDYSDDIDIDPDPIDVQSTNSKDKRKQALGNQTSSPSGLHPSAGRDGDRVKTIELGEEIHLPHGLRESIRDIPPSMQMAVLFYILPLLGAYADGVTVRYCDGREQQLGLISIIVGPQASGKSICKDVNDRWLKQMIESDMRNREIEEKWREQRRCRKANERAPEDPHVPILNVPPTSSMSNTLRRAKNAHGHTLYTCCEELDTVNKTQRRSGGYMVGSDYYRTSWDGGMFGQDYNSDNAESGLVHARHNFAYMGTFGALQRFLKGDNVENGLSSRIMLAEMPDNSFAPMPKFKMPSAKDDEAIDAAVTKLRSAHGFIDTPRLRKAIGNWVEEKRLQAMANADIVMDTYRKRSAVIGFRCGVIYLILEGKETKNCLRFATMIAEAVLQEQCKLFGNQLTDEIKACNESVRNTVNHSIFDELPTVFTRDDLQVRKGNEIKINALKTIISRWKKAGWIHKVGMNKWEKAKTP